MNDAHWHLVTNHLPIVGTYFSTAILITGILINNGPAMKAGLLLFALTALLCIPAFLTGEGAEDILEAIGQENHFYIHRHEELAEKVFWFTQFIGITAVALAFYKTERSKLKRWLTIFIVLLGITNSVLMMYVGNTGGNIRHTEIRDISEKDMQIRQ